MLYRETTDQDTDTDDGKRGLLQMLSHARGRLDLARLGQLVRDADVLHPLVEGAHHRADLAVVDVRREVAGDWDPPQFGRLGTDKCIHRGGYEHLVRVEDVNAAQNV
jgi:hypothetical protein